jgi:D-alanyl-D-alanine dipeptidase
MTKPTSKSVTVIGLRTDVLIALEKKGGNNEKGRHIMPLNSISTTYPTINVKQVNQNSDRLKMTSIISYHLK